MKTRRLLAPMLLIVWTLGLSACATTRSGGTTTTRSDRLTLEEIQGAQGAQNLYEVVQRLRPRWLNVRAAERSFTMQAEIAVYQGQTYVGNVESLRQMGTSMAREMRYLDGPTATATLPGLGTGRHVAGAIVLTLNSGVR